MAYFVSNDFALQSLCLMVPLDMGGSESHHFWGWPQDLYAIPLLPTTDYMVKIGTSIEAVGIICWNESRSFHLEISLTFLRVWKVSK